MDCKEVQERNLTDQYLLGQLSEAEQQAFEEHYFECPHCWEGLRSLRDLQDQLGRMAPQVRQERAAPAAAWMPRWAWLAGAAAVLLVAGLLWSLRPSAPVAPLPSVAVAPQKAAPPPAPAAQPTAPPPATPVTAAPPLAVLARVEPPPYVPVTLRGGVDEATERFQTAMKQYGKGNYAGAIPGLRAAAELNPKAANSRFFLAICLLLTGQTDSAIAGLQQVLALGDTPYLEEAHFYLAKAYLGKGSLTAAHDELERTIRLQGRLESEARQLLKQVNALKQEPPPG